jgi:quercetin dioxygenase-like cupin family protein
MATIVPVDEIRRSPTAALFEGARHGNGVDTSFFITEYPPGRGPDLHFHPYSEVFIVHEGEARFTVGDEQVVVGEGNVVVVPPETVHGFKATAEGTTRVTGIHPSSEVKQTDLE